MRPFLPLALLFLVAAAVPARAADAPQYSFDKIHTQVLFFVSHVGFSQQMGKFPGISGGFSFDPDDWSQAKADAIIEVKSLYLGDKDWEKKILSDEFFDAEKYPTMHFASERVEKVDAKNMKVHGSLTLRGVTQPVVLDVRVNRVGRHSFSMHNAAGFSATATIKRSDFGMSHLLPAVGDEIQIRLEVEGAKK
jgi:polyisoprenoid-binding protein YceI